jgi:hypothetical protein
MKNRNEQIKQLWNEKLNQYSLDRIMLSGSDFEKGRLNLEILESFGSSIQEQNNYKETIFSQSIDDIPLTNKWVDIIKQGRWSIEIFSRLLLAYIE